MMKTINELSHQTVGISLSVVAQVTIVLAVVGLLIWAVLFTTYMPVHDFFHPLRHALYIVPCH